MNKVVLYIQKDNGDWETFSNAVIPVKYGKLLDEQLDYATVTLQRVKMEIFKPLTRARLTVTSTTEHGGEQTETLDYFIANDDFFESPLGKTPKEYTHNLTLIELTKYLECFPLESLCFTNPSGNNYLAASTKPVIETTTIEGIERDFIDETKNINSPALTNSTVGFFDVNFDSVAYEFSRMYDVSITVRDKNNVVIKTLNLSGETAPKILEINDTFTVANETNYIEYNISITTGGPLVQPTTYRQTATYTIVGITNRYPLKPWTIKDVITRTLQLVEPLRQGETQRFSFDESIKDYPELFDALAPEFTFTRMNLREAMQTVGGYIHAEPRLVLDTVNGEEKYRITFDFYGENEYAVYKNYKTNKENIRLNTYKYTTNTGSFGIEQACTRLDSYTDNLVNRLDWESATVGQPLGETAGAQTLRTETSTVESESDNYYFPSAFAIDKIVKMEYIHTDGSAFDITAYIFENTVYNTLSSFDSVYPTSKSYALNFTYGQKGVKGFFYKVPTVTSGVGKNYSILNVINAAMSTNYDIKDLGGSSFYNKMKFRLTYVPIYSTRIQHGKQYLDDYLPLPRVVNYSQSDNSVETRFFGEHLKGAIQRMGNIDKNVTFIFRNVNNIPNAGELWDDDYYISAVSVAVKQDHFEVTCGLSKNFNRKSKYIGASTYKRIYEVSEVMVQERHTVYTDYVIVTDIDETLTSDINNTFLAQVGFNAIADIFDKNYYNQAQINDLSVSSVYAYGAKKNANIGEHLQEVILPVVASAFGNVMEFTWQYKDNFSAGLKILPQNPNNAITYFGQEVQYSDYYGRMYYYSFALLTNAQTQQAQFSIDANNLPQVNNATEIFSYMASTLPYRMLERKDSREALKKSYMIEIVADDKSFVVGSAFAAKNPLVAYNPRAGAPHLYALKNRINKYANTVDLSAKNATDLGDFSFVGTFVGKTTSVAGEAWVIAFPVVAGEDKTVEDEDGNITTIQTQTGGEVIIGRNQSFAAGETIGAFKLLYYHDIFKYIQAKNNQ